MNFLLRSDEFAFELVEIIKGQQYPPAVKDALNKATHGWWSRIKTPVLTEETKFEFKEVGVSNNRAEMKWVKKRYKKLLPLIGIQHPEKRTTGIIAGSIPDTGYPCLDRFLKKITKLEFYSESFGEFDVEINPTEWSREVPPMKEESFVDIVSLPYFGYGDEGESSKSIRIIGRLAQQFGVRTASKLIRFDISILFEVIPPLGTLLIDLEKSKWKWGDLGLKMDIKYQFSVKTIIGPGYTKRYAVKTVKFGYKPKDKEREQPNA